MQHNISVRYCVSFMLCMSLFIFSPGSYAAFTAKFKQDNTLTICSYSEFKPVSYGNGLGYEADLLRAVAALWQVNIAFQPQKIYENIWLLPSSPKATCDVATGGITPADYRLKQDTAFSIGNTFFHQSLLVKKADYQSGRIVSFKSFKNTDMKIGVVPGTTGEVYGHERAKASDLPLSVFATYDSESDLLPALMQGKIKAIARGEIGNEYQASLDKNLATIARQNFNDSFAFAVNPRNPALLKQLNEAIRLLTDNGNITYHQWIKNPNVFMDRVKKSS